MFKVHLLCLLFVCPAAISRRPNKRQGKPCAAQKNRALPSFPFRACLLNQVSCLLLVTLDFLLLLGLPPKALDALRDARAAQIDLEQSDSGESRQDREDQSCGSLA